MSEVPSSSASSAAIRKQVEFYFSDSNYRKDTFLRCAAENDPDGFVAISTLLTFNKLKSLTTDVEVVAEAIKDSSDVVLHADGTRVRRKDSLPENDTSKLRTLYAKGYPLDDAAVTIEAIAEEFSVFGTVLMVRLRRDPITKAFKGSCFVEFSEEAAMKEAVLRTNAVEGAVKIAETGRSFDCILPIVEWLERKEAKRKAFKMKKAEEDATKKGGVLGKRDRDDAEEEVVVKAEFTAGVVVKLLNCPADTTLFALKDLIKSKAETRFVDIEDGAQVALVRLSSPENAQLLVAALKEGLSLPDSEVKLEGVLVEGDEEQEYWDKVAASAKRTAANRGGGRGKRGGGRGGRGGGRFGKAKRGRRN